jgi:glutathione S-transferase
LRETLTHSIYDLRRNGTFCFYYRCFTHWYTRDANSTVKGYKINLQSFLGSKVPNPVLHFMMKHTYFRKAQKRLKAAGFATYTNEEADDMGKKDLKVLSELLGEKQFFFGDEPHTLDLKAFVWLALILNVDKSVPCPLRDYIEEECQNLVGIYNRMKVCKFSAYR